MMIWFSGGSTTETTKASPLVVYVVYVDHHQPLVDNAGIGGLELGVGTLAVGGAERGAGAAGGKLAREPLRFFRQPPAIRLVGGRKRDGIDEYDEAGMCKRRPICDGDSPGQTFSPPTTNISSARPTK